MLLWLQDDPMLEDYNVDERVNSFLSVIHDQVMNVDDWLNSIFFQIFTILYWISMNYWAHVYKLFIDQVMYVNAWFSAIYRVYQ